MVRHSTVVVLNLRPKPASGPGCRGRVLTRSQSLFFSPEYASLSTAALSEQCATMQLDINNGGVFKFGCVRSHER